MSDNPYENYPSDTNENKSEENTQNQDVYKEETVFDNPYDDVVLSSENVDFDDTPVVAEHQPASPYGDNYQVSEYVYPYNETEALQQSVVNSPVSSVSESSVEWYGKSPVQNTASERYPVQHSYPMQNNINCHKNNKRLPVVVIVLICMIVSTVFGSGSAILVNYFMKTTEEKHTTLVVDNNSNTDYTTTLPQTSELQTTEVVEKSADSVVEIVTEYVETGVFSQQYIQSGAGSGVIVDSNGYIVTNHHVIDGAEKISVTLRNGENYTAELIGSDAKKDLALLKIEADNLVAAVRGDSDNLKVGQRTIAIGNPLGQLGGTVTEGIISALDRDVTVDGQTMNLLQTDTAINPGNSGGGLFDGYGNLIGVVVAKSSGSEVEGLGFAIPINDAVDVISDLLDYGYVRGRIYIGMEFLDVTSEPVAWMYGLNSLGCYVYSVDRNSNAEEAGFKSGDLILKVDDVTVNTSDEIEAQLDSKAIGDKVEFTVVRGRSTGKISLVLEEYVPEETNNNDYYIEWYN